MRTQGSNGCKGQTETVVECHRNATRSLRLNSPQGSALASAGMETPCLPFFRLGFFFESNQRHTEEPQISRAPPKAGDSGVLASAQASVPIKRTSAHPCQSHCLSSAKVALSLWQTLRISFNSVLTREHLHFCQASYAERCPSSSNQHFHEGDLTLPKDPTSRDHSKFKIQVYSVSATAVLVYDYFLTFNDEVTEPHGDDNMEINLTTSSRSTTHGRRRMFSVRRPSRVLWGILVNKRISVCAVFICRFPPLLTSHNPDHRLDQIPSNSFSGLVAYW